MHSRKKNFLASLEVAAVELIPTKERTLHTQFFGIKNRPPQKDDHDTIFNDTPDDPLEDIDDEEEAA